MEITGDGSLSFNSDAPANCSGALEFFEFCLGGGHWGGCKSAGLAENNKSNVIFIDSASIVIGVGAGPDEDFCFNGVVRGFWGPLVDQADFDYGRFGSHNTVSSCEDCIFVDY